MNNSIPDKSEWPQTADGTTDWQALFEDEHTGLISIIGATQSPAELKQRSEEIIRAIFTRQRDKPILVKVTGFLEILIPDGVNDQRFAVMRVTVIELLGKIKDNRLERAAAYVEKQSKRKKQGKNKKKNKNNRRPNVFVDFFRRYADALVFALPGKKNSDNEGDEGTFYKQAAYVDHGGDGDNQWQDTDMYAMKEKESAANGAFEDLIETKSDDKKESWDDY